MKSIVSYPERGDGGNNLYRGNCSPKLIEDIIKQYKLKGLSDLMVGSGTTEDVCKKYNIPGTFLDLNRGFDLVDMEIPDRMQNFFWHPPYDTIVQYSDSMYSSKDIIKRYGIDPRVNDLSRCKNYQEFVNKMNYCCMKQFAALEKGGRMFILMGDIKKKGKLYSMLVDIIKPGTIEQIVIKAQHNCFSDSTFYSNQNFVPIIHEYMLVLRKDESIIVPVKYTKNAIMDMRDMNVSTWRDVIASVMESYGTTMTLEQLYQKIDGHKKTKTNAYWKDKIRQTLQINDIFENIDRGKWRLVRQSA